MHHQVHSTVSHYTSYCGSLCSYYWLFTAYRGIQVLCADFVALNSIRVVLRTYTAGTAAYIGLTTFRSISDIGVCPGVHVCPGTVSVNSLHVSRGGCFRSFCFQSMLSVQCLLLVCGVVQAVSA